jgi:hypothetical protein
MGEGDMAGLFNILPGVIPPEHVENMRQTIVWVVSENDVLVLRLKGRRRTVLGRFRGGCASISIDSSGREWIMTPEGQRQVGQHLTIHWYLSLKAALALIWASGHGDWEEVTLDPLWLGPTYRIAPKKLWPEVNPFRKAHVKAL